MEFVFLHKGTVRKVFTRTRGALESTEFSLRRFLVPYLSEYRGWSLFIDNDMVVEGDVAELAGLMCGDFAVKCVKHHQIIKSNRKFFNTTQVKYNMKNWTSVILFNNSRCSVLTPEYINQVHGLELHQFKWLSSLDEIGEIPFEWNYLCDVESIGQERVKKPKLIHYTEGGPFFRSTTNCEYAENWLQVYRRMNDYQQH